MLQTVVKFLKDNSQTLGLLFLAIVAISLVVYAKKGYLIKEGLENEVIVQEAPRLGDEFPVQSDAELSSSELLPTSADAQAFDEQFPLGAGDVSNKNFLTAGHSIGVNTVSSSLRNANLQIRSDPFIEPKMVSPFLNSTINPDMNRKNFEIGN